jgi:FkbM family methyltransferase
VEHLKWLFRAVVLLANWPEIYRVKFGRGSKPSRQVLKLRNGLSFEVAQKEHNVGILWEVFREKSYASALTGVGPDPLILDIGGNIGATSIFLLRSLPRAHVFVYEPEPLNCELLRRNLQINGFADRATVVNQAIAGTAGPRELFAATNSPANSFYRQVGDAVRVDCTTLEHALSDHAIERCDVLKIDCEGAEYEILLNTSRRTFDRIHKIVLEWHGVKGHSPEELERFLAANGFRTHRPQPRVIVADRAA